MPIIFQYFDNTNNVEFNDPRRIPLDISYTIITEAPFLTTRNPIFDIFGDANIFSFFNNLEALMEQQPPQPQKEKATREMITELGPYRRVNKDSNLTKEVCSICLDNFKECEGYRTLRCGHDFHKKCIDRWFLDGSQECPMCRKNAWGIGEKEINGNN